jgi:nitrous oxide reductase
MDERTMQNNNTSPTVQAERRRFLKSMAGTSAAVGLAATTGSALAASDETGETQNQEQTQGYHETDHIRAYYASCR